MNSVDVALNIQKKFEKMTAYTTDGNKLGFYVHQRENEKKGKGRVRLATKNPSVPVTARRK